jgi:hypothetical protein
MGRTVVVGDIHGCFDELTELLAALELRPSDLLVAAGDVVQVVHAACSPGFRWPPRKRSSCAARRAARRNWPPSTRTGTGRSTTPTPSRSRSAITWSEVAAAVARFAGDPASEAWLGSVERWAAELRALPLVPATYRLAAELDPGRWAGHPAARFLFQARDGRLTEGTMTRQCPTPRRTIEVAEMLGAPYPAFETVTPTPSVGRGI